MNASGRWIWIFVGLGGGVLVARARSIGQSAWDDHGRPFAFGTAAGFRLVYVFLGLFFALSSVCAFFDLLKSNLLGLPIVVAGAESALWSRKLAPWHMRRNGVGGLRMHQRLLTLFGLWIVALGVFFLWG
jgi:hypothetical protein